MTHYGKERTTRSQLDEGEARGRERFTFPTGDPLAAGIRCRTNGRTDRSAAVTLRGRRSTAQRVPRELSALVIGPGASTLLLPKLLRILAGSMNPASPSGVTAAKVARPSAVSLDVDRDDGHQGLIASRRTNPGGSATTVTTAPARAHGAPGKARASLSIAPALAVCLGKAPSLADRTPPRR